MCDFKQMNWVIPICQDEDLRMASLTAKLIKTNCSELVIALVSQSVNLHTRKLLKQDVDVVIVSQEANSHVGVSQIDMLLLESLNLGTRGTAIVIQPGVLVLPTILQVLKTVPQPWVSQEGVWKVVSVCPNPDKYELAVQELVKNGRKFDLDFIKCNIANQCKDDEYGNRNEAVLSWAQVKCYKGQDFPLIQLEPDVLTAMKLNTTSNGVQWDAPWQNAICNQLASLLNPSASPSTSSFEQNQDSWVAVVGMACRFPQANSIPEYWQVLSSGQNTASSPPANRLGKCTLETKMKGNFLKCSIDEFDASFFGLPPSETVITDPQARLLLEVSWEALEDACINPEKLRNKNVGVFHGEWTHDYLDILHDCEKSSKDFIRKYIGNGLGSVGARVSFFHGFTGPNIATDSACSSSLMAVELACKSLQNGECPIALASGSNIILQMDMEQKVIVSEDAKCKSFDSKADGYGRGEGVAVLVLKRYADALRDGDPIHGIILGSASTQEGMSPSIGTPTVKNEKATLEMALKSAKLSPFDVDYVEAHATGTKVGDPIEAKAIVEAYSSQGKERISPLFIGSVKTNIGHTEACSGIASLIKVLLAMKHETIPATINIETINPKVDFSSIPGRVCTEIQPWKKSSTRPRIAGISNFGITGTDAHLLVREPPLRKEAKLNFNLKTCPMHILALSAKTDGALDQLAQSFISLLEDETRSSTIEELTYTANACRAHLLPCRRAVVGTNKKELVIQLRQQVQTMSNENEDMLNIGFIFNTSLNYDDDELEQHAQLYHTFPVFQIHLNYCSTLCERLSGFSPLSSILKHTSPVLLRDKKLTIFSANYSLYKLWESWGLAASSVVGLNFGEIIGAVVADQVSLEHGVRLIIGNGVDISNEVGHFELNSTKMKTLYISGEKGELKAVQASFNSSNALPIEHWKRVCIADDDENTELSQQQLESWLLKSSSASQTSNSFIKVGQHASCQLLSILRKLGNEVKATEEKGLGSILSTLASLYEAGYIIDWEGFYMHRPCTKVSLPHYPFQRKSYWFHYELKRQRDMEPLSSRPTSTQQQTNHPLLGSYLAPDSKIDADLSGSQVLNTFETFLSPKEKAAYLSAHMIGAEIIFPAAAFLELLLAANSFQAQKKMRFPHRYILENFHVHHPLRLLGSTQTSLRTAMTRRENEVSAWSVFAETDSSDKDLKNSVWKQHATSDSSHIEPVIDEQKPERHHIVGIKKRAPYIENGHTMFYHGIRKVGLNFGNEFKILEEIYHQKSETLAQVPIPQDAANYICHPLLSDAMIQCYLFHHRQQTNVTALQVPVSIRKFVCYRPLTQAECWGFYKPKCHVYYNAEKDTVYLLDSEGYTLATMLQLELATTTVNSILKAAGVSNSEILEKERAMDSFETVWKPDERHQMVGTRCVKDGDFTTSPDYISLVRSLEQRNRFTKLEKEQDDLVNRLCELFVLKAFYEMGWKPKLGQTFNVLELANELEISTTFLPAFRHFLSYFVDNGVLRAQSDTANLIFQIENLPETYEKVEENIEKISASLSSYRALKIIKSSGTSLGPCLQGRVKGQQILFGSEDADGLTPAGKYYKLNRFYSIVARSPPNVFLEISKNMWTSLSSLGGDENSSEMTSRPIIRILEVGAGTGTFTKDALSLLEYEGIDFHYYFTDISYGFLKKAETLFAKYDGKISYSTLDIEKDPLEQGFPPAYFDVVVGLDVLHATEDLRRTLGFIQKILKTGGKLLIGETNVVIKEYDVIFGIVSGYWKFKDYDLRPTHCIISAAKWAALLRDVGFRGPSSQILLANNNHCVVVATLSQQDPPDVEPSNEILELGIKNWLLFHDFQEDDINFKLVSGIRRRMAELGRHVHPHFVHQLTELSSSSSGTSSFLKEITSHTEGILCLILGKDSLAENNCRAILEPLLVTSKHLVKRPDPDIIPKVCVVTLGLWRGGEEGVEVWSPSSSTLWGFIRCIRMELPGLVSKLVDLEHPSDLNEEEKALDCLLQELWLADDETEMVYRQGGRYCRRLKKIPIISDNLLLPIPNPVGGNYRVELPKSNLLSDVSYVSNLIEDVRENEVVVEVRAAALNFRDIFSIMKPSERFRDMNTIGIDFSGVVTTVGRKVTGLNIGTPVFGMSLKDSTITGYIQVPAQLLAVVPPTISFREAASIPVAFLTAWYCLVNVAKASPDQIVLIHAASGGVGLIAIQIAKLLGLRIVATAGNLKKRNYLSQLGIQHVFNSRTLEYGERIKEITNGKGVDIVLNCLTGPGFKETSLEICKVGGHFVEMSKLDIWKEGEVAERKPGVNYTIVDLPTVDPAIISCMLKRCSALLESGSLCPGPITYFTASRLVPALQFLQKAKHIGKVVVGMPLFEPETGMWKESLFNERSTYLITGGKGAIGLAIAAWMVSRGAKYLVLMGRSPPKESAQKLIQAMEEGGARILSMEGDISELNQVRKILEDIKMDPNLPPLRGVHHCAGVLSDRMLVHQDWDNFECVMSPKVKGAYNLHTLTLDSPLEFFVVHSSMISTLGHVGQSNYAAGSAYLEALIEKRCWMGLPGMCVNWGLIKAGLAEQVELTILNPASLSSAIEALELYFLENRSVVNGGLMKFDGMMKLMPVFKNTFFEYVREKFSENGGTLSQQHDGGEGADVEKLVSIYFNVQGEEEKKQLITNCVKHQLAETLGIGSHEVREKVQFSRMGLDSLLSIEFYNRLQRQMGKIDLGYIDMESHGTLEQITELMRNALEGYAK